MYFGMCYDDVSRNTAKRIPAFKKRNLSIHDYGMGVCGWIWDVSVKRQRICRNISGSNAHVVNGNRCIVIYHVTEFNHYFRDKKQKLSFLWYFCWNSTYQLVDGRYMDRTNTVYIYDGKDTWTDTNGVEWNQKVK